MTKEEAVTKMNEIYANSNYDPEIAHSEADDLLCQILTDLGYGEVVAIFERINKWYA